MNIWNIFFKNISFFTSIVLLTCSLSLSLFLAPVPFFFSSKYQLYTVLCGVLPPPAPVRNHTDEGRKREREGQRGKEGWGRGLCCFVPYTIPLYLRPTCHQTRLCIILLDSYILPSLKKMKTALTPSCHCWNSARCFLCFFSTAHHLLLLLLALLLLLLRRREWRKHKCAFSVFFLCSLAIYIYGILGAFVLIVYGRCFYSNLIQLTSFRGTCFWQNLGMRIVQFFDPEHDLPLPTHCLCVLCFHCPRQRALDLCDCATR